MTARFIKECLNEFYGEKPGHNPDLNPTKHNEIQGDMSLYCRTVMAMFSNEFYGDLGQSSPQATVGSESTA